MRKKRVLIHTNWSKLVTGFGKNCRNVMKYLSATGKYEILEAANILANDDERASRMPWPCRGTWLNSGERDNIERQQPQNAQLAIYGHFKIDKIVKDFKPDVYLGIEDVWAFYGFQNKVWWPHVTSMIWTTLDSSPIAPESYKLAKKTDIFRSWASFAQEEMNRNGVPHVKTLHGSVDVENFQPLSADQRRALRDKHGIDEDTFVVGFVFKNQLRKSVFNLFDGFKQFKLDNPSAKAKLILHTEWHESGGGAWNIPQMIVEKGIDPKDV
jgi:glycosyltransferase involved in cell wall biosynthesis